MKTKVFLKKSDWPYCALGIQILKVRKHRFSMNNENFQERRAEPGPRYDNYGGSKDKLSVFMENEKNLKQCFERRSECVY